MTKYLEFTTRLLQYYIVSMLTVCAILLSIIVFSTTDHNQKLQSLIDELSRLELVGYEQN